MARPLASSQVYMSFPGSGRWLKWYDNVMCVAGTGILACFPVRCVRLMADG